MSSLDLSLVFFVCFFFEKLPPMCHCVQEGQQSSSSISELLPAKSVRIYVFVSLLFFIAVGEVL